MPKIQERNIVVCVILSMVTCGIYMFYWNYQMGKKLYEAGQTYGKDIKDNSVLYLILSFTGFGAIVNEILIQIDLNRFAD